MKKLRLKKDLPGVSAGRILNEVDKNNEEGYMLDMDGGVWVNFKHNTFPEPLFHKPWIPKNEFYEWFEWVEDEPKRWRAALGESYFTINNYFDVCRDVEEKHPHDAARWENFNYFQTQEQAEAAAKLLKETLMKFHEEDK